MAARQPTLTPYRALVFAATVFAVASFLFLLDNNLLSQRDKFQESDFIMTFYVAGHLAASGRSAELYPQPDARSFIDSPFDKAAHALLPHLPKATTGAYMYIPLVAGLFVPFSFVGPNLALFFWQALSVLALGLSCVLLSRLTVLKTSDAFFLSFLYAPVFLTLWAGQLGLGFGLLPLCVGFFLLVRERPLAAGLVWSLLLLKPQYFPAAAFVSLVFALVGHFRLAVGTLLGVVTIFAANLVIFSPALVMNWLASHRLSDALFTDPRYGIPTHLITSLPANILFLVPSNIRPTVKWPTYCAALLVWAYGLYSCWIINRARCKQGTKTSLILAVGCILSSICLPHLLYYDLCLLIPVGFLLISKNDLVPNTSGLRSMAVGTGIIISIYLPLTLLFKRTSVMPFILETILLICLTYFQFQIGRATKVQNAV